MPKDVCVQAQFEVPLVSRRTRTPAAGAGSGVKALFPSPGVYPAILRFS